MPKVNYIRLIVVFQADSLSAARDEAIKIDRIGGGDVGVGLVPAAGRPDAAATWYWFSWAFLPHEAALIRGLLSTLEGLGRLVVFDGGDFTPEEVLTLTGLQRIG